MSITIRFDHDDPIATVELIVRNQIPGHRLDRTEAPTARELAPVLASKASKLLLDEVRAVLEHEIENSKLEIVEVKGVPFRDAKTYRPGILFVLRERGASEKMSESARERVTEIAETIREELSLS